MVKRIFLALCLLALCVTVSNGGITDKLKGVIARKNASGGYSDIDLYWGAEDDTAEKSSGDSSIARTGATLEAGQKAVGAKSLFNNEVSEYASLDVTGKDIIDHDEGRLGFYLYITDFNNDTFCFRHYTDANNSMIIKVDNADEMRFIYEANGSTADVTTADSPIVEDTWQFWEFTWNNTTDVYQLRVNGGGWYADDGGTPGAWGGSPTTIEMNNFSPDNGGDHYTDQWLFSTDTTRDLNAIKDLTSFPD